MIIDGHAHVILPVERHLVLMDAAGVDHTILFGTRIHPERADNLDELEKELRVLDTVLAGNLNNTLDTYQRTTTELAEVVQAYPERFTGFGNLPLSLTRDEAENWIQQHVLANGLRGLGEFTLAPGQIGQLETVFELASDAGNLPLWVHTFAPLRLEDIQELITLSRRHSDIPLILGHLGGLHWRDTIRLAKENPQTYLDLSATYTVMAPLMAIRELPERTICSSDAPFGSPLVARVTVEQATESQEVRTRVLGGTIAQLLQLG
jgi:predicted TIM-barrel fold metal-dependent hydrolase